MYESLQVLQIREPFDIDYAAPTLDVSSGDSSSILILPPVAPVVLSLTHSGLTWQAVNGATGYIIEQLASGVAWNELFKISAPPATRIFWTGITSQNAENENQGQWEIDVVDPETGKWDTLYLSPYTSSTEFPQPPQSPDQIGPQTGTSWQAAPGVATPVPDVDAGIAITNGGMTVSEAGDSRANGQYQLVGLNATLPLFYGPFILTEDFVPGTNVFYRVRAFNSAGIGAASNLIKL
jgi:hypothetical protein